MDVMFFSIMSKDGNNLKKKIIVIFIQVDLLIASFD